MFIVDGVRHRALLLNCVFSVLQAIKCVAAGERVEAGDAGLSGIDRSILETRQRARASRKADLRIAGRRQAQARRNASDDGSATRSA